MEEEPGAVEAETERVRAARMRCRWVSRSEAAVLRVGVRAVIITTAAEWGKAVAAIGELRGLCASGQIVNFVRRQNSVYE
jgi:hypothetical protein